MGFKNFLKNKFQIVAMCVLVLLIVSSILTRVSGVFLYSTCILGALLCWVESAYFFVKVKQLKNGGHEDLLPLTPEQRAMFEKQNKSKKTNTIIKAVMLMLAGVVFVAVLI